MAYKPTKGLDAWVTRLGTMDLPVLANVINELNELAEGDDTSANQLADAILKDAALTSQVLRIANSVHYNPQAGTRINTISRAVVVVGFSGIRAICISVMLIDSLLGAQPKDELLGCLARGFHAAVQARNLVGQFDEDGREEAFIAALLMHLGDMAFWSRGGKQAEELADLEGSTSQDLAVQQIIGTDFRSITVELAKQWGLGETLINALLKPQSPEPKSRCAVFGDQISIQAEKGWNSPDVGEVFAQIAEYTGKPLSDVRDQVLNSAEEAAEVAATYGAQRVCHLIPSPSHKMGDEDVPRGLQPDPQLQLEILRELAASVADNTNINTLFQMVLEGLHRGVGLERVGILLLNPRSQALEFKYTLGDGAEPWRDTVNFSANRPDDNIFAHCLYKREVLVLQGPKVAQDFQGLLSLECKQFIGRSAAALAPIYTPDRSIGVIYADRGDSGAKIDESQQASFNYFIQQANNGVTKIASKRKK